MASASHAAALAFHLAGGSVVRIMEPLLCFLGGPSPRNPAVDQAAVFLLVVLPTACVALAYLHPHADGSFADLWRFAFIVFTLVSAWLLVLAVFLAIFYFFLGAGKLGTGQGLS